MIPHLWLLPLLLAGAVYLRADPIAELLAKPDSTPLTVKLTRAVTVPLRDGATVIGEVVLPVGAELRVRQLRQDRTLDALRGKMAVNVPVDATNLLDSYDFISGWQSSPTPQLTEHRKKELLHAKGVFARVRIFQITEQGALVEGAYWPLGGIVRTEMRQGRGLDAHKQVPTRVHYEPGEGSGNVLDLCFVRMDTTRLVEKQIVTLRMWPIGRFTYESAIGASRTVRRFTASPVEFLATVK